MTTTELDHWIKLGLGCAVTRLRTEEDKSPFYGVVLRAVATNYYQDYYPPFYIYDLIRSFDSGSGLEADVIAASTAYYNNVDKCITYCGSANLLRMFYDDGNSAAGDKFDELYTSMLTELKNLDGVPDWLIHDKTGAFLMIVPQLAAVRGEDRLCGIIHNMEAVNTNDIIFRNLSELTSFFISDMRATVGDMLDRALDIVRKETKSELMLDRCLKLHTEAQNSAEAETALDSESSFDDIYEQIKNGKYITFQYLYRKADKLTTEQRVKIAKLAEGVADTEYKFKIIFTFTQKKCHWPLDPAPLIALLHSNERFYSDKNPHEPEMWNTNTLVKVLGGLRDDTVHDYAIELIERGYVNEGLALWVKNLRPGERGLFEKFFRNLDLCCDYYAHQSFIRTCEEDEFDEPNELLIFIYENSHDILPRFQVIKELKRRGAVSDGLAEECRYDISNAIRELF